MSQTGSHDRAGPEARNRITYDLHKKSVGVAYLLWFILGGFSGHRFYLGRYGSAFAQLALMAVSLILGAAETVGGPLLAVPAIWVLWTIVDLFLIPGIVRKYNEELEARIAAGYLP